MHRLILPALLLGLTFPWSARAQEPVPLRAGVTVDPVAQVQAWYRQFLDRDVDPTGLASWTDQLRRGQPPAAVLASILSSEEYYQRAGSTPEGFVRALFQDLTRRAPPQQEWRDWERRARSEDRKTIAQNLVQRYAQAWQPPADVGQRSYLANIQERARWLLAELERFQEDAVVELRGQRERELYQRADAVLTDLRHFRRSLHGSVAREHLVDDFRRMDRKLHDLLETVHAYGDKFPSLQRAAARVRQADQQLHYALFQGDTSEVTTKQVVARQAHALAWEAQEFERIARFALTSDRPGRQALEADVHAFTEAAEHLHKGLRAGFNRQHLLRDMRAMEQTWSRVVRGLRVLTPRENVFLVRRAERLDLALDRLHRQLALEGERTRFIVPLDQP